MLQLYYTNMKVDDNMKKQPRFIYNFSKNSLGLFIVIHDTWDQKKLVNDTLISKALNLSTLQYQEVLINNYNAIKTGNYGSEIYFKTINDVQSAIEWIESIFIAQEMTR